MKFNVASVVILVLVAHVAVNNAGFSIPNPITIFNNAVDQMKQAANNAINNTVNFVKDPVGGVQNAISNVASGITWTFQETKNAISNTVSSGQAAIKTGVNLVSNTINPTHPDTLPSLVDQLQALPANVRNSFNQALQDPNAMSSPQNFIKAMGTGTGASIASIQNLTDTFFKLTQQVNINETTIKMALNVLSSPLSIDSMILLRQVDAILVNSLGYDPNVSLSVLQPLKPLIQSTNAGLRNATGIILTGISYVNGTWQAILNGIYKEADAIINILNPNASSSCSKALNIAADNCIRTVVGNAAQCVTGEMDLLKSDLVLINNITARVDLALNTNQLTLNLVLSTAAAAQKVTTDALSVEATVTQCGTMYVPTTIADLLLIALKLVKCPLDN